MSCLNIVSTRSKEILTRTFQLLFYAPFYWDTLSPYLSVLVFCNCLVRNIEFDELDLFELDLSTCKIQVWNIKLAKSKISVRIVKNVVSKWTKMEFPRFLSLWFTVVAIVNPPDQKLEDHQNIYPSPATWKKNRVGTKVVLGCVRLTPVLL